MYRSGTPDQAAQSGPACSLLAPTQSRPECAIAVCSMVFSPALVTSVEFNIPNPHACAPCPRPPSCCRPTEEAQELFDDDDDDDEEMEDDEEMDDDDDDDDELEGLEDHVKGMHVGGAAGL